MAPSEQAEKLIVQLQEKVAILEQENTALKLELEACKRSPQPQKQTALELQQHEYEEVQRSDRLLVIAREQEKAATERAAELAKANEALKRSLDSLASEPSLDKFLGQVLTAIAEQFNSPMAEYWYHPEETVYVGMMSWYGQIFDRAEISKRYPTHPGVAGLKLSAEQMYGESLQRRKQYFIREDWYSDPFVKHLTWHPEHGLDKEINIPMVLGDHCIGALIVRMSPEQQITTQHIELAQALAHQATLAAQLTQLAEAAKQAAIAHEREKAATERAAELAKANEVLRRTASQLIGQQDLNHFLNSLLLEVAQEVRAVNCSIFLCDRVAVPLGHRQANTYRMCNAVQDGQAIQIETDPRFELWRTPISTENENWKLIQSRGYIWSLLETDEVQSDELCDFSIHWHHQMQHRSVMCVLLQVGDEPLGYMGLCFRELVEPSLERISFIQALANQAALGIQLTQLSEEAKQAIVLEERNRMAREIHDTLAQAFTGISIHLGIAHRLTSSQPESARHLIEQATQLAHTGLTEARRSVWNLYADADEYRDLVLLLTRSLEQMTSRTAIKTEVQVVGTPYTLPSDVGLNLLRIGQEAITNALKYAQAQHLIIELQFTPTLVSLRVQDDGCGFDPHHKENGGFGLVGMQQRCQRIGGQLTINSQPGQGTAIMVEVPLVAEAAKVKPKREIPVPNRMRVLVVDDHPVVRQGLVTLLQLEPSLEVVAQASDGMEAVEQFRLHQPDVTLMDLQMPRLSGVEAIATIRAEFPTARIIILTTYDGEDDIYRGLKAGALGYLLKDASSDEILKAIRQVHTGQRYLPTTVSDKLARIEAPPLSDAKVELIANLECELE